jgi:general secretion pathway protein A
MSIEYSEAHIFGSGKDRVYLDFYHLKEAPFSITPDPGFLFYSNTHQSAIDKTLYGINNRMGFLLLTGEVGTGKTTICRSILDRLDDQAETVYIINPSLSGRELILSILDDLGIGYEPDSSKKDLIDHLNHFALSVSHTKPVVIIIDDAQTMPIEALEDLRLISNLETDKEKLLQMVLVGQPELIDLISRPEIRQLRQRIAIKSQLGFLSPQEVEGYITRRLFVAGDKGQIRFTRKAQQLIAKASNGIPRLINKICDYALTSGYISNDFTIGHKHIKKALAELGDLDFKKYPVSQEPVVRGTEKNKSFNHLPVYALIIAMITLLVVYSFNSVFRKKEYNTLGIGLKSSLSDSKEKMSDEDHPAAQSNSSPPTGVASDDTETETFSTVDMDETNISVSASTSAPIEAAAGDDSIETPPSGSQKRVDIIQPGTSYIVQLASFRTIDSAASARLQFKEKNIEAHWDRVDLGKKGVWYRLYTGYFATQDNAAKFKIDHGLDKSIILFAPWSVVVTESASQQKLEETRSILGNHQIDNYTLKTREGGYKLLTGAFVTKIGAEKMAQEMIALGYDAKVVRR